MAAPQNYRALVEGAGAGYVEDVMANDAPYALVVTIEGDDATADSFAADVMTFPDLRLAGSAVAMAVSTPVLEGEDTVFTCSLTETQVQDLGAAPEIGREIEVYARVHRTPSGGHKSLFLGVKLTRLGS